MKQAHIHTHIHTHKHTHTHPQTHTHNTRTYTQSETQTDMDIPLQAGSVSFHCGLFESMHSMMTEPCSKVYPGSQVNSATVLTAYVLSLLVKLPYLTNGS